MQVISLVTRLKGILARVGFFKKKIEFDRTLAAFRVRQDFRQFVTFVTFCDLFQPCEMAYGIRPLREQNDILILNNEFVEDT